MAKFMVLAYTPNVPPQISPEEMQQILQKFYAWTNKVRQQGRLLLGDKLFDNEGRVLRAQGDEVIVTDGPFLESKEVLGGFWIIEAASYDEALQLISDHPNPRYLGGTLELRQIEPT